MILFCGIPSEPPLELAIQSACRRGIDHVVFNQRESHFSDVAIDHHDGVLSGCLWLREHEWPIETITGIYTRMIESDSLPENRPRGLTAPDADRVARSVFLHQVLTDWIEIAECRVVNRARAMSSNASKPYQMQFISRFFDVPPTLVTNEPEEALAFIREHERVIYKSISSVRSIVQEWSARDESSLRKIRALPVQFQAFISGTNVRVHVVGTEVFATEIRTAAVDYRYANRQGAEVEMRAVELPCEVSKRCRELASTLRLPFCGIDLKRTEQNTFYCFEVNPSPAYSYYQEQTGQPIADALVDYLAGVVEEDRGRTSC